MASRIRHGAGRQASIGVPASIHVVVAKGADAPTVTAMNNTQPSSPANVQRADVVVIDGTNLVHRCHHALKQTDMATSDGVPIWALHGLVGYVTKLTRRWQPSKMIVAFDVDSCSSRKLLAPDYKKGRNAPDPELVVQLAAAPALLAAAGFSVGAISDWEADDVCATVVEKATSRGLRTAVVSSDKDTHQLISATCVAVKPEGTVFDDEALKIKWGIAGDRWVEYAALIGEKSDNLEGVNGIGPKRAVALITNFGDVADAFADLEAVERVAGSTVAASLAAGEETFVRNRKVGTLRRDLDIGVTGRIPASEQACDVLRDAGLSGAANGLATALASIGR